MNIQVAITGDRELVTRIGTFVGSDGLNLKRSMGASGLYLTRFFAGEVYTSRGRIIGKPWPRLNEGYAQWKARAFPGRPPLIRSGEMNRSYKFKAAPRRLELWNSADHFDYHQDGTSRIPARVTMRVDEQRAARVAKYFIGDITEQMSKAGLL